MHCCCQNSLSSWPVPHVVAAPVTSRHLTHVLLQPVASVVNPTPAAVCHTGAAAEDMIVADQWRRSLVIDTNESYVPVVSCGITYISATLWCSGSFSLHRLWHIHICFFATSHCIGRSIIHPQFSFSVSCGL